VTVARNRCRNILAWRKRRPQVEIEPLADWIASPERNPLDAYEGAQVTGALRSSLAALDQACRELLTALFLQGTSAEAMCETLGLTTVRAVYYRRENCLKSLQDILMRALGEDAP
jgi:DNA-directed RNA polymerase specialized sigma24 family protein